MGAWDPTSFGNDTANDWAYDLESCIDTSYIDATLQRVVDAGEDDIDGSDAEMAIAAAEVIAWLLGNPKPVNAYTEKIAAWVSAHPFQPSPALIQKAVFVLDRIQREPSELPELWEGDHEWLEAMAELRSRLTV